MNKLSAVYHGEQGIRTLKELARSYLTVTRDLTRVMSRLKAIYRGWAIPCAGEQVYAPHYRAEWLAKISEAGVRRRAELYYVQFDTLAALRQGVRRELLAESRKHPATRLLRQIPSIGPIRAALLVALIQTPNRFRTKRQLWAYCGLATSHRARTYSDHSAPCSRRGNFSLDVPSYRTRLSETCEPWGAHLCLTKHAMKQVIVLRRDLQMSTGKPTVQACHASVAAVLGAKEDALESWNVEGQTKIVLEVNSLAELQNLKTRCEQVGILHVLISDAGRTELAPGTITALAIGPADDLLIDKITGSTPLLK